MIDIVGSLLSSPGHGVSTMLDVGTGSGAISVACCTRHESIRHATAIDLSEDAVRLARENAEHNGMPASRLTVVHSSLAEYVPQGKVDLLVSNPPYLPTMPDEPEVAQWEDSRALLGGEPDGLGMILDLLRRAPVLVRPGGHILLEGHITHPQVLYRMMMGEEEGSPLLLKPGTGLGAPKVDDTVVVPSLLAHLVGHEYEDLRAAMRWRGGYYDSFGQPRFMLLAIAE
jgi:HemK-like putative methylase